MHSRKKIASLAMAILIIISAFALLIGTRPADSANPINQNPSGDGYGSLPEGNGEGTTSLEVSVTAQGVWEKRTEYDWSVGKFVLDAESQPLTDSVILEQGESLDIVYDIYAQKSLVGCSESYGVCGTIIVKNVGGNSTQGLSIVNTVQTNDGDGWEDYTSQYVDISSKPQLAPGESCTYSYRLAFVPASSSEYKDLAKVLIDNYESRGTGWGVAAVAQFCLPAAMTTTSVDSCARITDNSQIPTGFSMTFDEEGPWTVQESQHIYVKAVLTNVEAAADRSFLVINKATLVEGCSGESRDACASLCVLTGEDAEIGLVVEKSAIGYWNQEVTNEWSVTKSVDQVSLDLKEGESRSVTYTIEVTKTSTVEESFGVFGQITIMNRGDCATLNLAIYDEIWYLDSECGWVLIQGQCISVADRPLIAPGEMQSYGYEVQFDPVGDALCYKNVAYVHDDNAACSSYYQYYAEQSFSLPKDACVHDYDGCADLVDLFGEVPTGLELSVKEATAWHLCDSGSVQFVATISNDDMCPGEECCLENTAILTMGESGCTLQDTACVSVRCHSCCGHTYTIGYWKNHDGTKRNQADMITPLLDKVGGTIWLGNPNGEKSVAVSSASQAGDILGMENQQASNGMAKLYAQLLAAKLNILNGACPCAVDDTISASHSFLAEHDAADWSSLISEEQQTVLDWKTILDEYNNDVIGPGHWD